MKIRGKIIAALVTAGLLPFAIVGAVSLWRGSDALETQSFSQLEAVRAIKQAQIRRYFADRQGDAAVLTDIVGTLRNESFRKLEAVHAIKTSQIEQYFQRIQINLAILAKNPTTVRAVHDFHEAYVGEGRTVNGPQWTAVDNRVGHVFGGLLKEDGYYDVFLIAADGSVVYSATREPDLGENLLEGRLKASGLATAFRLSATQKVGFSDLAPYEPSANKPAAFLASEIRDETGARVGAVAVQIPVNQIDSIMQERNGLGRSGETYLVGPDLLMRSNSYLDPKNHSVEASFADPAKGMVDTKASRAALDGRRGSEIVVDYNGNPVLSAYAPVDVFGVRWAMMAEVDVDEAFVPVDEHGKDFFSKYIEKYGYYDLFLIDPNGFVYFTVAKEPDYRTNMVNGKYANSNLGKLVQQVLATKSFGFTDFAPYEPSNGDPAAFIAQPLVHDGVVEAIVALQLPLDGINAIMQERTGMGQNG